DCGDLIPSWLSRRTALRGATVGAGTLGLSGLLPAAAQGDPDRHHPSPRPTFDSVLPNTDDAVTVRANYDHHVIIPWADAVLPNAPELDIENHTTRTKTKQSGYNCD